MKNVVLVISLIILLIIPTIVYAGRGCCSHHDGQWYCDENAGRWVCKDGTYSPSCRCSAYTFDDNSNNNNNSKDNAIEDKTDIVNNKTTGYYEDTISNILAICILVAPFGFMLYEHFKSTKN